MTSPITYRKLEQLGLVEIEIVPDESWDADNMCGTQFDSDPAGREAYLKTLKTNGVWGVLLSTRVDKDTRFIPTDSVWGVDDYDYADTTIREEMEEEAVRLFNELCARLRKE